MIRVSEKATRLPAPTPTYYQPSFTLAHPSPAPPPGLKSVRLPPAYDRTAEELALNRFFLKYKKYGRYYGRGKKYAASGKYWTPESSEVEPINAPVAAPASEAPQEVVAQPNFIDSDYYAPSAPVLQPAEYYVQKYMTAEEQQMYANLTPAGKAEIDQYMRKNYS